MRRSTGEFPIFVGPMFLHANNDFECFADFFNELSTVLRKMPSPPVIGVDDEGALHGAASHAFGPESKKLHCLKHLSDNSDKYLQVLYTNHSQHQNSHALFHDILQIPLHKMKFWDIFKYPYTRGIFEI